MRYILCFLLPHKLSREINLLREHFEKGVSVKIAPHISLTYPFWYEGKVEELKKKLERAVSDINLLVGEFKGIGVFRKEQGKMVIFGKIALEESFVSIHEKLNEALPGVTFDTRFFPNQKLPEKYKPHITLALNGEASDVEFAEKEVKKIKGKEFLIDQIAILSNENQKGRWRTERIFTLPKKLPKK